MSIDHNSNCLGNALDAAKSIHVAMCLVDRGHAAQTHFVDALHCVLIVAEEARQQTKEKLAGMPAPIRELLDAADLACEQGDFHNGVTDSTGSVDEGDVKIGRRLKDAIRAAEAYLR